MRPVKDRAGRRRMMKRESPMYPTIAIGVWMAALLVGLAPRAATGAESPPAVAGHAPPATSTLALVDQLDGWLDVHSDLPRRDTAARIVRVGPDAAERIMGPPGRGQGPTRGFYDPDTGTIYLVEPWSAENPADVSVLLHELIHHRQDDRYYACPGAQELPAYRAQKAWLAERGLPLDVNWIAIVLAAGCTPRGIHPD